MTTSLLRRLNEHPEIKIKECSEGIKSYNFTRKAFQKGIWDETTVNARGLFMRGETIVGRGYNKFFNLGQEPGYTESDLKDTFVYPLTVSRKANGYLAIAFVDVMEDEEGNIGKTLRVFTKSGDHNGFAYEAERIIRNALGSNLLKFMEILEFHNASATFEIISDNDVHIVDEGHERPILLDLIPNTEEFRTLDKRIVDALVYNLTLNSEDRAEVKSEAKIETTPWTTVENYDELQSEIQKAENESLTSNGVEGLVIEDAEGRMTKINTKGYLKVKSVRGGLNRILSGKGIRHWNDALRELDAKGALDQDVLSGYLVTNVSGHLDVDLPRFAEDWMY